MRILAKFEFFNPHFPVRNSNSHSFLWHFQQKIKYSQSFLPLFQLKIANLQFFFNYPKNINAFIFYYFHENLHSTARDSFLT